METKVVAILLHIVEGLRKGESIQRTKRRLMETGHSSAEIDSALSYLLYATEAHSDLPRDAEPGAPSGIRVLTEAERFVLSSEAYGYLLKLRQSNVITALQMEAILDEILTTADEMAGVEEVKELVARLLADDSPADELLYAEEETETEH